MKTYGERCEEYNKYLETHIGNVKRAWKEKMRPLVQSELPYDVIQSIDEDIENHDKSKYDNTEYDAYLDNFYPADEKEIPDSKESDSYQYAWNHHQKNNPHHWQYWVLVKDEGTLVPLDMPISYVLHMLCDWDSFSYVSSSRTTKQWYDENKSNMTLSKNTKALVEKYLEFL